MSLESSSNSINFARFSRKQGLNALREWFKQLKIRRKIALGYAGVIAIAVGGSTLGNEIGDYYLWQAWQDQDRTHRQIQLLYRLQNNILHLKTNLETHVDNSSLDSLAINDEELTERSHSLRFAFQQLKTAQRELEQMEVQGQPSLLSGRLSEFVQRYQTSIDSYITLLETAKPHQTHSPKTIPLESSESPSAPQGLPSDSDSQQLFSALRQLIQLAELDAQQAQMRYDRADAFRLWIATSSVVLSICLAISMAIVTSHAIAYPLQVVNQAAKQITLDANFKKTVPVLSKDEIGQLSQSLNQLIQRVQSLLEEQEFTNAELGKKNIALSETLATLKQTQAQMIQAEKMSGLGRMVAGIAHEINNPATFIKGNLDYTKEYFSDLIHLIDLYKEQYPNSPETIQTALDEIDLDFLQQDFDSLMISMTNGVNRIGDIVQSLRAFSRLDEVGIKLIDIHTAIDNTLLLLTHRLQPSHHRPRIVVTKQYQELPKVECYVGALNQVFMGILINAIDAVDSMTASESSQPPILKIQTKAQSDSVCISIADNGPGIPDSVKPHIFDPFFTTKPVGQGSGLGLAVSHQIVVDQHRGNLTWWSSPRETTFTIQLPIRQSQSGDLSTEQKLAR